MRVYVYAEEITDRIEIVGKALRSYGFVRAPGTEPDGEIYQGWQWRKQ